MSQNLITHREIRLTGKDERIEEYINMTGKNERKEGESESESDHAPRDKDEGIEEH